jgi:hypothetical protein
MIAFVTALLFAVSGAVMAQATEREYLGLPGDNLNLYAVMSLFQESETLEAFERGLNDPESMINNLDLNGDGYVDYIMVLDYLEGNVHNIVLRVALNERDYQDVAVFVVEKLRDGAVMVQLIGDEALYGENYIIEPVYAERPNPGYTGNSGTPVRAGVVTTTYYEVAAWPVVRYIHSPTYVVYRPVYRYGYYPVYWQPWRAHYWHYYYGFHYPMHAYYVTYYRPWRQPRTVVYHTTYYTSIRRYSPVVIVNVHRGTYKNTYTRPEKRRDGEAHFERVYAHRGSGTMTGGTRTRSVEAGRSAAIPARFDRQETVTQPAARPGTSTRASGRQAPESNDRITPARTTTIQRSNAGNESGTRQPAAAETSRTETRSTTAPAVRESRQGTQTPANVEPRRTESRSTQPAVRESRQGTQTPAVQPNRSESSRGSNSAPAVRESRQSNQRSSAPAVRESRSSNQRSSAPAVRESRSSNQRSSAPARTQPSRTGSRNENRSN